MTLTKHVYDAEECGAALLWSIQQRDIQQAQFWIDELEESGIDARGLLLKAWALSVGISQVGWLNQFYSLSHTRKGRRRLLLNLLRYSVRDSSTWWLLCSLFLTPNLEDYPIAMKLRDKLSIPSEDFWEWCLETSTDERIDSLLESLQEPLGSECLCKTIAFHLVVYQEQLAENQTIWDPLPDEPILWRAKAYDEASFFGRTESIPSECLLGMTYRGSGCLCSTLHCLEESFDVELRRSPYWNRLMWKEGTEKTNPEAVEQFFDTHFGNTDIPDEWSMEERSKSHGFGMDVPEDETLSTWCERWIGVSTDAEYIDESLRVAVQEHLTKERFTDSYLVFYKFAHRLYR
jgi:hypothetical protein